MTPVAVAVAVTNVTAKELHPVGTTCTVPSSMTFTTGSAPPGRQAG